MLDELPSNTLALTICFGDIAATGSLSRAATLWFIVLEAGLEEASAFSSGSGSNSIDVEMDFDPNEEQSSPHSQSPPLPYQYDPLGSEVDDDVL